jgi:hypothetical protein
MRVRLLSPYRKTFRYFENKKLVGKV